MKKYFVISALLIILTANVSCEKFLAEKPKKSILVPQSKEDVRYLLDYYTTLNENPLLNFTLSDDWITTTPNWEGLNPWFQNSYLWKEEIFAHGERSTDFSRLHRKVFYANICLDILGKIGGNGDSEVSSLRGEALFVRAAALFYLAKLFLPHPDGGPDTDNMQIPIQLSADVNAKAEWMTIKNILDRIEADLTEAYSVIEQKAAFKTRPDKVTVKALLSRFYLYSGNYGASLDAANSVLNSTYKLLNYAELSAGKPYPFTLFNEESIYYGYHSNYLVTDGPASYINPDLYADYVDNDFRKQLFFKLDAGGKPLFKGSYTGGFSLFTGITYSEILLNAAESAVRLGRIDEGMGLLNTLAQKRYKDLKVWTENIGPDPLETVMRERRRELVFRGTRWMDMKRLAAKGELQLPISREIRGVVYRLENDRQFTLSLPLFELELENKFN
ncbi:RagB/SusD family nutrient uptake outer membrane protein [Pedobacter insulae]|uniref:SusD family protein n=1 Tax=Pedobacter insulae TaxID=414048 RepID=A0A1I3AM36_9SPHI|nr:RagB/SusD family nutrient uptake outer membrane protein [Pedobacter insulae]SFH51158.1 SusD family protein [Pedobacter insulae]